MVAGIGALDRKLIRDLWHLRGQVAAIGVVVACGVATVVTTRTSYTSLLESRAAYYADYRFADLFVHAKRCPETLRGALGAVPGVIAVETRIVAEITLDVPGLAEPATGRLVSIPERRRPILNDLYLRHGRLPEPARRDEVIVSAAFAEANALAPGDSLGAVFNGRWQRLRVVGVAISPEYVYEIGAGGLFPDNRRFGVLWMGREALAPAFQMVGAFNDATLALAPGASEGVAVARIDRLLEPCGGLGAYGRGEQPSARFLADEIAQNRVAGTFVPAIFLGIAAFLLSVVLARLVATQREQIAVLKAFGYNNHTVGWHYLKLAFVALLLGAVVGVALGLWLAAAVNQQYAAYYRFPEFFFRIDFGAVGIAVFVTLVAAAAGAIGAVRRVVALPPAAALQPEPPARFRPGLLERLRVGRRLPVSARMIMRSLERRPGKAGVTALGVALAVAILVTGRFFVDSISRMAELHFRQALRANVTVVFNAPRSAGVRYELERLPGVLRAEPFRSVPARVWAGHRSRRIELMGLESRGELRRLVGAAGQVQSLPPEGAVITAKLAEVLGVTPGDTLLVDVLEGARPSRTLLVAATLDELFGMTAYLDQRALNRLLHEGNTLSGAFLRVDPVAASGLNARLKRLPGVAGVSSRDHLLESFEATLAESIGIVTSVLLAFASAIAVAMIYNAARVALSERGRELASLRVLGFRRGEVALMLLGEQAVLATAGILVGLPLGYWISAFVAGLYQWEVFRMPLVITRQTYTFAVTMTAAAGMMSAILIRRRLDRLDLVAVLKARE